MDSGSSPHARGTPSTSAASRSSFRFIPAYAGNARRPADAIADHPVHPRMRGERLSVAVRLNSSSGSSPHARGTLDGMGQAGFLIRFIPACAGNAISGSSSAFSCFGSSPHARGTHGHAARGDGRDRFIPACAGNAWWRMTTAVWPSVHPRMRGERGLDQPGGIPLGGSSPHARGTPAASPASLCACRFIPACAGNASLATPHQIGLTVHPRMRGERSRSASCPRSTRGSSPHARGTRTASPELGGLTRFIPACAGNAKKAPFPFGLGAVHPRMRGERTIGIEAGTIVDGSSPHARGTRRLDVRPRETRRFIPACAGNARKGMPKVLFIPVHPRMRGERLVGAGGHHLAAGSSPHARGTPDGLRSYSKPLRFIPACAGNAYQTAVCVCDDAVHPRMRGER